MYSLDTMSVSGVISRQVLPACGSLCFFCPAMRARSRQPVKRYKKLISDIFPRSQVGIFWVCCDFLFWLSPCTLSTFSLLYLWVNLFYHEELKVKTSYFMLADFHSSLFSSNPSVGVCKIHAIHSLNMFVNLRFSCGGLIFKAIFLFYFDMQLVYLLIKELDIIISHYF